MGEGTLYIDSLSLSHLSLLILLRAANLMKSFKQYKVLLAGAARPSCLSNPLTAPRRKHSRNSINRYTAAHGRNCDKFLSYGSSIDSGARVKSGRFRPGHA